MQVIETYLVKGQEKESFLDDKYKAFEKEVSPEELIEMIKSAKVTVDEVIRKTVISK